MRRSAALTPIDLWSSSAITANSGKEFAVEMQDGAGSTATFPPSTPAHPVMNGTSVAASRKRPSGSTPPTGCVKPSSVHTPFSCSETGGRGCGWATSRRGEDSRSRGRGKSHPSASGPVRERPGWDPAGPPGGRPDGRPGAGPETRPEAGSSREEGREEGRSEGRVQGWKTHREMRRMAGPSKSRVLGRKGRERKRGTRWAQPRSRRAFRATSGC